MPGGAIMPGGPAGRGMAGGGTTCDMPGGAIIPGGGARVMLFPLGYGLIPGGGNIPGGRSGGAMPGGGGIPGGCCF